MSPKAKRRGSINIQKITEQRLLDTKLLPKQPDKSFNRLILISAVIGLLVGGTFLGYIIFSKKPVEPQKTTPEIVIPRLQVVPNPSPQPVPTSTPSSQTLKESPQVTIQKVEILATPTGFLNARSGPGTNFEKIAQVRPGETYEVVSFDQGKGWYQIRLSSSKTGWITAQYVKEK